MSELLPAWLQGADIFVLETGLVLTALYLSLAAPRLGDRFFRRAAARLGRLARQPALSLVAIGVAPVALRLLLIPVLDIPRPQFHDEFSYLLAGETFAHGRAANPTHPFWEWFETFHVLQHPTYASMYPPAQGTFLAIGFKLGLPWLGVCLSVGLMCAALLWMLRGWFPPTWALLGASLAVIRLGLFSYWMNTYWGGAVGALGGALAAGALPRLWRSGRPIHAVWMGLGFILLANSRPFEGMMFSIPIGLALLWRRPPARVLATIAGMLAICAVSLAWYNWRVTGDPFQFPERLQRRQYAICPDFAWEPIRPEPAYRSAVMRELYVHEEPKAIHISSSLPGLLFYLFRREHVLFWFFLGPLLALPLLLRPGSLFGRKRAVLMLAFLFVTAGIAVEIFSLNPHYYSPATCLIYAFVVQAMRSLRHARWFGKPSGLFLVRAIPAIAVLLAVVRINAAPLGMRLTEWPFNWSACYTASPARSGMIARLNAQPGKILVMVRYLPENRGADDWVHNEPDIDAAKVVWARELDQGNEKLLAYFHDRRVYLVEPDVDPTRLLPYTPLK